LRFIVIFKTQRFLNFGFPGPSKKKHEDLLGVVEVAAEDSIFRICSDPVRLFWYQDFS
jgi:hypothetical protein